VRVSLVQFAAATDRGANLDAITRLVGRAVPALSPDGAGPLATAERDDEQHLVVLPEGAMHDIGDRDRPLGEVAEPLDGPFVSALGQLARDHRIFLLAGVLETSPDAGRPFNTLVALDPEGRLLASYRKIHLYDSFGYRESERLSPGNGDLTVLPVGELTLGLQTCYDLRFPELSRALVDAGADVLAVPAAWVRGSLKEDHWATLLRARAIENTVYVLGAGQCGRTYIGCSMVVDPMGVVVAGLGPGEGVASGVVDPAVLAEARRVNPSLANRRLPVHAG
jgi:predicted amidohydrolase